MGFKNIAVIIQNVMVAKHIIIAIPNVAKKIIVAQSWMDVNHSKDHHNLGAMWKRVIE